MAARPAHTWAVNEVYTAAKANDIRDALNSGAIGTTVTTLNAQFISSTPGDGATGKLLVDASPYDVVPVVYDTTVGKWFTEPSYYPAKAGSETTTLTTTSGTFVLLTDSSTAFQCLQSIPWRAWDTAGLKPYFRLIVRLNNSGGGSSTVEVAYRRADASADWAAGVEVTATQVSVTGTSQKFMDSDWQVIPAGYTVADLLVPEIWGKATSGTCQLYTATIGIRWQS